MTLEGLKDTIEPKKLFDDEIKNWVFTYSDNEKERVLNFTVIMDTARKLGISDTVYEEYQKEAELYGISRLWEVPRPIENSMDHSPLPSNCLPDALWDYMQGVAEYLQVCPEMCILPMLSVLSLCVQGKAVIKHPHNEHTEPLNLYTITIAEPSMRKSPTLSEFIKPVELFENMYNEIHAVEINDYKARKKVLESREKRLLSSPKGINEEEVKKVQSELAALKPKTKLCMNITDATPEALTQMLHTQSERLGLLDGEGGVFDTISGIYTGGKTNIDVFLKAYSGEKCVIVRVTRGETHLNSPLLTMGLMTQPKHFIETLNNKKFTGRGLMHRFMYSFPQSANGDDFVSQNVPERLKKAYSDIAERLLSMKTCKDKPMLIFDRESYNLLHDYNDKLIKLTDGYRTAGNEDMESWYGKHFGRCMRIAGLLHLCEYEPTDKVTAATTAKAIKIAEWAESQAERAFGAFAAENENKTAKYILKKIKSKKKLEISRKEISQSCHMSVDELNDPLELLEVLGYIQRIEYDNTKFKGRPPIKYKINPYIME